MIETIQNWYMAISTIAFAFLFIVWTGRDWGNLFIKLVLLFLLGVGFVCNWANLGIIVKVPY